MSEPRELEQNEHWRMAVWALRAGYLALVVVIAGVIVLSSGSSPWVLAIGAILWLAAAAITLTGVVRAWHELPEPRPGFWAVRFMLIRDTIHLRSSTQPS